MFTFQARIGVYIVIVGNEWEWDGSIIASIVLTLALIASIGSTLQPLIHTIVSFNRLTAFAFLLRHSSIWRPRTVLIAVILAALGSIAPLVSFTIYFGTTYSPLEFGDRFIEWSIAAVTEDP